MQLPRGPRLERNDRYVRRTRLQLSDRAASQRVAHSLSEALRLTSLPGEEQGRVYYMRHVALRGVPADGDRTIWLEQMQLALAAQAHAAVHGAAASAGAAAAVYFHSDEEALELLLQRLIAFGPAEEWFWPLAGGIDAGMRRGERIVAVVERLRSLPAAWTRVAAVVFSALEPHGVAELGAAIPVAAAQRWLRELGDDHAGDDRAPAAELPQAARRALHDVQRRFGREDPRTLWLAALAVVSSAPATGSAVARARATLRQEAARNAERQTVDEQRRPDAAAAPHAALAFDPPSVSSERTAETPTFPTEPQWDYDAATGSTAAASTPAAEPVARMPFETREPPFAPPPAPATAPHSAAETDAALGERAFAARTAGPADAGAVDAPEPEHGADAPRGALTEAAGLLFLLNAMTWLGIARVLDVQPALAEAGFVVRLLARLAAHARVAPADPLLPWLQVEIARTAGAFAALQPSAAGWPALLGPPRPARAGDLVRAWELAVRRVCRRVARLTVPEIVSRRGYVLLSRADIDVTLPLHTADIRVRRAGLDIDPGWLPWLGRVVRFHYARGEPGAPAC